MRLKTFLSSYLLFLVLLFATIGVVSAYLTTSQMEMLKDRSLREYQTISTSFANDFAHISNRLDEEAIPEALHHLLDGYSLFYSHHYILLDLAYGTGLEAIEASFINEGGSHFVQVRGPLREPFQEHILYGYFDISDSVTEMQTVQRMLLVFSVTFSIVAAVALHFILSRIFQPLGIITKTSRKIADGQFSERINVGEKGELATVAGDFNRMAARIEEQITFLEEEALQKQQFVDNFAHEIRTPLTSIFGYAQYMQRATLDEEELIDSLQYIMDESSHMKKIANSLLELATLRNFTPVKHPISLKNLFEDIQLSLGKTLQERSVHLKCELSDLILEGQEDLIRSLLLNLCFNAIKASQPHQGIISLRAFSDETYIYLEVQDNGHGIPADSLSKVTEAFYRTDNVRNRQDGGAGLGLALCQQIVEVHHGKLHIKSQEKVGTTVTVSLPKGGAACD